MTIRYTPSEGLSDPSRPTTMEKSSTPTPEPVVRQNSGVTRVVVGKDGEMQLTQSSGPTKMSEGPNATTIQTASARNAQGIPISLDSAGPLDVLTIGGLGDGQARVWEQMGVIRRKATGGYELATASPAEMDAVKAEGEQQKKEQEAQVDFSPSHKLSDDSESNISVAVKALGAPAIEGSLNFLAEGKPMPEAVANEWAQRMGMEPAEVTQAVAKVQGELASQAQAEAEKHGVVNFDAFTAWARREYPEAVRDAVRRHFDTGRTSGYKALAERFVADSEAKLSVALERNGLKTSYDDKGRLVVDLTGKVPGAGKVTVAEAVSKGLIEFNG